MEASQIDKLRKELDITKKSLTKKLGKAKRQKKYRDERQQALKILKVEKPSLANTLHVSYLLFTLYCI